MQALIIDKQFVGNNPSALVLGDNIFYRHELVNQSYSANQRTFGAAMFIYHLMILSAMVLLNLMILLRLYQLKKSWQSQKITMRLRVCFSLINKIVIL